MIRRPGGGWAAVALAGLLLLTGCAGLPESATPVVWQPGPAPKAFHLTGRVSVKTAEQSFSGSIDWQRSPETEILLLSAPLGQGVASLTRHNDGVLLRDSEGREFQARDAEALVREVVGVTLPMRGLGWWVAGRPRPDAPFEVELDAQGQLSGLRQDDWDIQFSRYESRVQAGTEYSLPRKLRATRGESLEVRLVVDDWELP